MRQFKDAVVVGLALFAMFFGAGNLIFPPKLGVVSGDQWWLAIFGFFSTDVVLSMLGVIAIAKAGGTFNDFAAKVGPRFSIVMGTVIMLSIGPLLAIPRTGAVSYEMGMLPIYDGINQFLFTSVYFGIAILFVLNPKGIIDKIGTLLTPVLLIALLGIIVKNIISPAGVPETATIPNVFGQAFVEGYQTLDGFAAVTFAGIILMVLKQKGYEDTGSLVKMTIRSGIISFGIIGIVYGGLIYLGACGNMSVSADMSRTQTFMALVEMIYGNWGIWIVSAVVFFACFTTTAGLIATVSEYFDELTKGKLSYRTNVYLITLLSFVLANMGVEQIVRFSGPLLGILYPSLVVLILLNLIDRYIPNRAVYAGAVYSTLLFSILTHLSSALEILQPVELFFRKFPLSQYEMGWVMPALIGAMILPFVAKVRREHH